jgi:AMMECR1 domain-containing protein
LQQCFFGEHLLALYPDKIVSIIQSENSGIIAPAIMPELVWLAAETLMDYTWKNVLY